ncbi:MAG TPA: hypothetical protein VGG34_09580 [Opitutaceae bacterium]|jgi:hypothetical protein
MTVDERRCPRAAHPRWRTSLPELARVSLLVAAAVAIMAPYLTGNLIGGVDGRWYGYMLADYIEQVRQGQFLVTVGQGEFAWNGSVHLFRSAPVYMMVGRVWDLLTLRSLNPFALQHLTVVTSAAAGAVGFYAAAVQFIPNRRWAATGIALLYLGTPAWLSTVLRSEAYMSYMAFAAMPLVLYGNTRTALGKDGRGYVPLGAGLALIWMCHPPIAFISTLVTLFIQGGLVMVRGLGPWRNLAAGAGAFAVLGAFYFVSMGELPPRPQIHPMGAQVAQVAGLALFLASIGRIGLRPRSPGWIACAALGALTVGLTSIPWLCWIGATAFLWACCVAGCRKLGANRLERHAVLLMFLSMLGGAAIAGACVGHDQMFSVALATLGENTKDIMGWLRPLKTPMDGSQIFQPGFGLIAIFLASVLSLIGPRPAGAKLFFAAAAGLVVCFFRVPLVSDFLVGTFPVDLAAMCGIPLGLRLAPVIASVTAIAGVVWLATAPGENPRLRLATGVLLCAFVAWNALQCAPFIRHSRSVEATPWATEKALRVENAALDAYAYLLLPIPAYFSNGKTDPALEIRILDSSGQVVIGPIQDAEAMEAQGSRTIWLTTHPLPGTSTWFAMEPKVTVEPGEHLLLRFEFNSSKNYSGFLILKAENSYREYHLPDSGFGQSFGVGGKHTSVLSLWNSGSAPEHYELSMSTEPANTLAHDGGLFARLHISKLDPSRMPIRLESFMPLRASVTTKTGGTLETFRASIPGYRATVDGQAANVGESADHLVTVRVPPGTHEVVVRFAGTMRLWFAAILSGLGWICFVLAGAVILFRRLLHSF